MFVIHILMANNANESRGSLGVGIYRSTTIQLVEKVSKGWGIVVVLFISDVSHFRRKSKSLSLISTMNEIAQANGFI